MGGGGAVLSSSLLLVPAISPRHLAVSPGLGVKEQAILINHLSSLWLLMILIVAA